MQSSSVASNFRLRETDTWTQYETSSDVSSVSSDRSNEIESMTARGIKHLCSELLELKAASDEDFQKNVFANSSAFVRILEEVKGFENELKQLKTYAATQIGLIRDLMSGTYLKILSTEAIQVIIEDCAHDVPAPPSDLEIRISDISKNLDMLLSENKIDEALDSLELEDENFREIHLEDNHPSHELMLYNSVIAEKKAMLMLQLRLAAENPRISAPELQKAVLRLFRLGESHLAIELLLKYYHLRIVTGTNNLQCSKSSLHLVYIRELAKFVFSMISQAAKSFVMLCRETSLDASEFMQWAREETRGFINSFNKYVKSIAEESGGLSTAAEAVRFAVKFCSLLETQKLTLQPYLVKHLCPSMEEVLEVHVNYYKKAIAIFSANDVWDLERYLISGIFDEGCYVISGQQPEYCSLTSSGRKFLMLIQEILEDVQPLVSLQMGGSILCGLMNLFSEYTVILESALTNEPEGDNSSRINLAESLPEKVSLLANLSTLVHLVSVMVKSMFKGVYDIGSDEMENQRVSYQLRELENFLSSVEEASEKLRAIFCQKFILGMFSMQTSYELILEDTYELAPTEHNDDQCDANNFHILVPSGVFQALFLELRKFEQLAIDDIIEEDWLIELLRELMTAIFHWVQKNEENQAARNHISSPDDDNSKQLVLDVQFLVEIAVCGGYFSNDPLALNALMKSTFLAARLDPIRDVNNDKWAITAAIRTIQRLLEIQKTILPPKGEHSDLLEGETPFNQSEYSHDDNTTNRVESDEALVSRDDSESNSINSLDTEFWPCEKSLDRLDTASGYDDTMASTLTESSLGLEKKAESGNVTIGESEFHETRIIHKTSALAVMLSADIEDERSKKIASVSYATESVFNRPVDGDQK